MEVDVDVAWRRVRAVDGVAAWRKADETVREAKPRASTAH
jgi:hypothetical protein